MKISWGTGLAVVIITFLIVTIGTVLYIMTIDVNLVAENYYEQEIKYQEQIDKIERTNKLPAQVNVTVDKNLVSVVFPTIFDYKQLEGEILLFRPSNKDFDIEISIKIDSTYTQTIKHPKLFKGLWKAKINWNIKDSLYYNEEIFVIN